jgi:hypothetical protein
VSALGYPQIIWLARGPSMHMISDTDALAPIRSQRWAAFLEL